MWNPDAISFSFGGTFKIGPFSYSGSVGWLTSGSHGTFYVSGTSGGTTSFGIDVGCQASMDFYVNKTKNPFSIIDYAGKGYQNGIDMGILSFDYGGGVTTSGLLDTSKFSSYGIGLGTGVGFHGGVTGTTYILDY